MSNKESSAGKGLLRETFVASFVSRALQACRESSNGNVVVSIPRHFSLEDIGEAQKTIESAGFLVERNSRHTLRIC